ncbi:condensation domain-containing protein [Scytonema sp. NUACC21]
MNYLNRKLGPIENLFEIAHDLGGMILVNIARLEGSITPNIVREALDLVQKHHPMLQVYITESVDGFYFQSKDTSKIPFRVVDKQHEEQWIELAQDELHQKFPGGPVPLCRVTLLRSRTSHGISEIIATFHHAIADGLSCMVFIDELLSYCQRIAAGDSFAPLWKADGIPSVATMQLLPAVENLLDSSLIGENKVADSVEKPTEEIQPPKLIIESEAPASKRRTRFITRILSTEMTIMLRNRCKQEETTVHGALCAAMLFGAAKIIHNETPIHLSCGSAIDLRKFCKQKVNDDYIGCLATAIGAIPHTLEKYTNFWDLARECKSKISHSLSQVLLLSQINTENLQFDRDLVLKFLEPQMGRGNTVEISNLGEFPFKNKYGKVQLKELYFATGQHLNGSCFALGVVTFHQQIFCRFTYIDPLVSTKTAELFVDSVMETIKKAGISQSFNLTMLDEVVISN